MSESETPPVSDPPPSNHYRIRKEVVALCVAAMVGWAIYQVHDWWTYMDWPPYDGSNKEFISSLRCAKDPNDSMPTNEEIKSWSTDLASSFVVKQEWARKPQCAAHIFFFYEGSGIRKTFDIVDVEKKKKMAQVVVTFERDERSYK